MMSNVKSTASEMYVQHKKRFSYAGVAKGGGHEPPPPFKSGGHKWVCAPPPPTFGQTKCSKFTIFSYFVVKNTIFSKNFLARFARQF